VVGVGVARDVWGAVTRRGTLEVGMGSMRSNPLGVSCPLLPGRSRVVRARGKDDRSLLLPYLSNNCFMIQMMKRPRTGTLEKAGQTRGRYTKG
jgi:hypothetical protein